MRTGVWVAVLLVLASVAGCVQTQPDAEVASPGTPTPQPGQKPPPQGRADDPEPSDPEEPRPPAEPAPPPPRQNETPEPPLAVPLPPPGNRFRCGSDEVVETYATHGTGDANVSSLAWAALKLGNRFAVAWNTGTAETGKLHYQIGAGPWVEASEGSRRRGHVVVLDGLPIGQTICFRVETAAGTSEIHGARLENAMNAYNPADGTYTLNLLTLANELPHENNLQGGYGIYANKLWDATDGYVRAGTNIVVYGDLDNHNSGWVTCYIVSIAWAPPLCAQIFDVIFSHESDPRAAAFTYRDAIQEPEAAIWMNQLAEANRLMGIVSTPAWEKNEVGTVLLHEVGHYAFGALDLYGELPNSPDCYDSAIGLSVMGGSRQATEFDDEINRCPNASSISGYQPTWTLLRERFPMIPERTGLPMAGPDGDGGAFTIIPVDARPF